MFLNLNLIFALFADDDVVVGEVYALEAAVEGGAYAHEVGEDDLPVLDLDVRDVFEEEILIRWVVFVYGG